MARSSVRITGVNQSIMRITQLEERLKDDFAATTEAYARKIANDAAAAAPEDTGYLKNSIETSPTEITPLLWELGSELPYATRQEYEHKTQKGFMRNAVSENQPAYYDKLKRITEGG